jgi:hypothetical protein
MPCLLPIIYAIDYAISTESIFDYAADQLAREMVRKCVDHTNVVVRHLGVSGYQSVPGEIVHHKGHMKLEDRRRWDWMRRLNDIEDSICCPLAVEYHGVNAYEHLCQKP